MEAGRISSSAPRQIGERRDPAEAVVGPPRVVVRQEIGREIAHVGEGLEDERIEDLVAIGAVEASALAYRRSGQCRAPA